jgi:hypothetical protein
MTEGEIVHLLVEAYARSFDRYARDLGDGREATIVPLTFGRARICIGPKGGPTYDDGW